MGRGFSWYGVGLYEVSGVDDLESGELAPLGRCRWALLSDMVAAKVVVAAAALAELAVAMVPVAVMLETCVT